MEMTGGHNRFSSLSLTGVRRGLAMAALLLSGMAVSAQGVMFVYDPYRHAIVSANNNSSLKRFERIGNLKMDVIANKEKTAANYMVLNILEEHLYAKEKSLSNGNLASGRKLYEQTVKDVAEFWEQYHETYVLSSDSLRMKCEDYYERAKANSDYEMDQIERRVAKYVRESGFIANNTERITMMENCYERARAEKMRVIYHGRVLFSLAVYREGFREQQIDVLKNVIR